MYELCVKSVISVNSVNSVISVISVSLGLDTGIVLVDVTLVENQWNCFQTAHLKQ